MSEVTAEQALARKLVGVLTVGMWDGRRFGRARHFTVTSSADARTVVNRIATHQGPGRQAVHITALAAGPTARAAILRDVADQVVATTRQHPKNRGVLGVVSWSPRAQLEDVG